jgi:hypothetical protein
MTIAATRMYRSLMDLGSIEMLGNLARCFLFFTWLIVVDGHPLFSVQESLSDSGRAVSKVRVRTASVPIPLVQMKSVRTEADQSSKSQMAGSSSHISTDSHGRENAHEVSHNVNVTSGPEK